MKIKYNIYQSCKKCGCEYLKTRQTGNQCDTCRRGKKRVYNKQRRKKDHLDQDQKIQLLTFVNKVEKRDGFIYSLLDLNELIDLWYMITPAHYLYDKMNPGHQAHHMWKDLLEFSRSIDLHKEPQTSKSIFKL